MDIALSSDYASSNALFPVYSAMRIIDIKDAKKHLGQLVEEAANGDSFIIAKAGKPLVKVIAFSPSERPAKSCLGFPQDLTRVPDLDKSVE